MHSSLLQDTLLGFEAQNDTLRTSLARPFPSSLGTSLPLSLRSLLARDSR